MSVRLLDLFAGVGGFRLAAQRVSSDLNIDFTSVGFSENDRFATESYKAFYNTEGETEIGDIISFCESKKQICKLPDFNVLAGGFPCQPFSSMGRLKGFEDERGGVFFRIIDILLEKQPQIVLLENVKNLLTHDNRKTIGRVCKELKDAGYPFVEFDVFNSSDFGLPQNRNRVFILAMRDRADRFSFFSEIVKEHFEGLKDPSVQHYETVLDILERDVSDIFYLSRKIKPTILSNGTGNFHSNSEINQLIARPLVATMVKMHRACQDNYYSDSFINSGGRENDSKLPTAELIENPIRKLTPREALMLQGFPEEFALKAKAAGVSNHQLYKQSGNAVSVNVVYAILRYLVDSNLME